MGESKEKMEGKGFTYRFLQQSVLGEAAGVMLVHSHTGIADDDTRPRLSFGASGSSHNQTMSSSFW